jgi:hypothetical protein
LSREGVRSVDCFGKVFAETTFPREVREEGRNFGLYLLRFGDEVAVVIVES